MVVARSLQEIEYNPRSIVTIGTFDGVHRGHQHIIHDMLDHARSRSARTVVVTFTPHPREVVGRGPVKLLTTLDERIALLEKTNVHAVLILNFTFEFSRQTPREFYEHYIVRTIGGDEVVVGHDHMFGRDREAGVEELRVMGEEFGFAVHEVSPFTIDGEIVSSSKIREFLLRGDVQKASRWLGRPYTLAGHVVRGDGRGASIGFPTANVRPYDDSKVIPAEGVYFVELEHDNEPYSAMLSIGVNPTFKTDGKRTIEVHIFDFQRSIYGEQVRLRFIHRLRGEQKFPSSQALVEQMRRDREACMKLIAANEQSR